jgi:5-methyltetrahydrofolate--homocysteine methyltransferase
MQREGMDIPLLIGGATTSRVHTAVKIAPSYACPVVHVLDASRAVGVAGSLLSSEQRGAFDRKNRDEQESVRTTHRDRKPQRALIPLQEARTRRTKIDWGASPIEKPSFTGLRTLDQFPLEQIVPFIDWSPFFHVWELRGRYPQIFEDATVGPRARELFEDARKLLGRIAASKLLSARAVYGFFPANSVEDDIEVYAEGRSRVLTVFHCLRQQAEKPEAQPNQSLADFIAPRGLGVEDFIGAFALTAGIGVEALCAQFERDHDDYSSIMTKALADRLAEGFAELLHKRVRQEWGYGLNENLEPEDLVHERYRGIRPAPGYPACPDHTEKRLLFDLLSAEARTGISLTESFAMLPASSVSGLYLAHPEARYFSVGKIARDQVLDYSSRKGMAVGEVERWLAPNLGYDPGDR